MFSVALKPFDNNLKENLMIIYMYIRPKKLIITIIMFNKMMHDKSTVNYLLYVHLAVADYSISMRQTGKKCQQLSY